MDHTVSLGHQKGAVFHVSMHMLLPPLIYLFVDLSIHLVNILECLPRSVHHTLETQGPIQFLHSTHTRKSHLNRKIG